MSRMGNEFIRMKEAGEIPQDTSVSEMIPVKCHQCRWEGYTPQLKLIYKPDTARLATGSCPACLSDQHLETMNIWKMQVVRVNWLRKKEAELEQVIGYKRDIPF